MTIYDNPRSASFINLCPMQLEFNMFQLLFLKKNPRPLEAKFHMEPPWDVRMKICSNVLGHMTKMASRPIYMYVKTSKKFLLQNQEADDLETWYTASGTQVLPNLVVNYTLNYYNIGGDNKSLRAYKVSLMDTVRNTVRNLFK